ncbi:MAG: hypothetical protein HC895_11590 [Leptolyngbyaceae cyanobacterium SM1_3_5]|nr:hypothetical protein [Leptolyngbyaceae cyanobacterium SM1_3_5]
MGKGDRQLEQANRPSFVLQNHAKQLRSYGVVCHGIVIAKPRWMESDRDAIARFVMQLCDFQASSIGCTSELDPTEKRMV